MNQVVTELVIDGRGAEVGSASYVRAMQVAQAAVDRLRDREDALKIANEASGASMVTSSTSTLKAASAYDRLKASIDPVFAASKGLEKDILTLDRAVTRLGISEAEAGRMLDLVVLKHDAVAAAAKRQADAYRQAAAAARDQQAADLTQGRYNAILNVRSPADLTGAARTSAATFSTELDRLDEIAQLKARQAGENFAANLRTSLVTGIESSARESAMVFAAELDRLDQIAALRAQQAGANFAADLNARMGIGRRAISAQESASVFAAAGTGGHRLSSGQLQGLGYQANDVVTMALLGAPTSQIAFSQGGQILQTLQMGEGGISGSLSAIKGSAVAAAGAIAGMLGPIGMIATGFGAATLAAGAYYISTREKAKELNEILAEQKNIVQSLAPAYQELAGAGQGPFENLAVARLGLQANLDDARKLLKDQQQSALKEARGAGGTFLNLFGMLPDGAQSLLGRSQASIEFDRIVDAASKGEMGINDARAALAHFGQEHPDFSYVIGRFISMTDTAAATERQVKSLENTLNRLGDPDRASVGGPAALDRAQRAGREGAVMRQRFGDDPLAAQREQQRQKEIQLTDAQDQRKRSLDATLASARLDIELIGQTTAQVEAQRMAFQLEQQVREEAAQNNTKVDEAEIALIREKAAEYGRLRAQQQAQSMTRSQQDDLELQRAELGLIGQNALAHDRTIAALKAEQEIRKLGIPLYGNEANAIRANIAALSDLAAASSRAQLRGDLQFDLDQLGRSPVDQQVAAMQKQYGLPVDLSSADAAAIRYALNVKKISDAWNDVRGVGMDAISDLVDSAANGFRGIDDVLKNIAGNITKQLLTLGMTNPILDEMYPMIQPEEADGMGALFSNLLPGGDQ